MARIVFRIDESTAPSRRTSATASAPCTGVRTAERKRGDIHTETPERGADHADHAGNVSIPSQQKSAFQRSFERDSVERENSRRAILDHGSFDGEFGTAIGRNYLKRIRKAALAAPRSFFHNQPRAAAACEAFYKVHLFVENAIQQTDQHRAADYVRTQLGWLSCITNADVTEAGRRRSLGNKRPEAFAELEIRAQ